MYDSFSLITRCKESFARAALECREGGGAGRGGIFGEGKRKGKREREREGGRGRGAWRIHHFITTRAWIRKELWVKITQ